MTSASRVPDGFTIARVSGGTLVAREESLAAARVMVERAGSLHEFAARHGTALAGRGRGVAHRVTAADGEWVVRHYRRGGAMAGFLADRYLRSGTPRPICELHASEAARERGVPTPRVEAAFVRASGAFYRADLATRYLGGARDLATCAFDGGSAAAPEVAWHAAGALLRRAFDAGVVHPDLNLGNVLLTFDGGVVAAHLIDLDRARVVDALGSRLRGAMLARFHRSRRKLERASGRLATPRELAAFEAGLRA